MNVLTCVYFRSRATSTRRLLEGRLSGTDLAYGAMVSPPETQNTRFEPVRVNAAERSSFRTTPQTFEFSPVSRTKSVNTWLPAGS